jgi:hypothetical protein
MDGLRSPLNEVNREILLPTSIGRYIFREKYVRSLPDIYRERKILFDKEVSDPSVKRFLVSRRLACRPQSSMMMSSIPIFDDAAKERAKKLAVDAGKPGTQKPGLVAIHAVLNRKHFRVDEEAYLHYGAKKQRYYEWKPLVEAASSKSVPPILLQTTLQLAQQPGQQAELRQQLAHLEQRVKEVKGQLRQLDDESIARITISQTLYNLVGLLEGISERKRREDMPAWPLDFDADHYEDRLEDEQQPDVAEYRARECLAAEKMGVAHEQLLVGPRWMQV